MPELNSLIAAARSSVESKAGRAPLILTDRPGASERRGGAARGAPSDEEEEGRTLEDDGGLLDARAEAAGGEGA